MTAKKNTKKYRVRFKYIPICICGVIVFNLFITALILSSPPYFFSNETTFTDKGICVSAEFEREVFLASGVAHFMVITLDNGNKYYQATNTYIVGKQCDWQMFEQECIGKEIELRYTNTQKLGAKRIVELSGAEKTYITMDYMNRGRKNTYLGMGILAFIISVLIMALGVWGDWRKIKEKKQRRRLQNKKRTREPQSVAECTITKQHARHWDK